MRDLIAVILAHGELARRFGNGFREGVGAAVTQIEGVVNLTPVKSHVAQDTWSTQAFYPSSMTEMDSSSWR